MWRPLAALCEVAAGARRTQARREGLEDEEQAIQQAAELCTELATYWSNSATAGQSLKGSLKWLVDGGVGRWRLGVRPYALRGSPFLRPTVHGGLQRLQLRLPHRPGALEARLVASQQRRYLEIELHGALQGTAWCVALTPSTLHTVVVPPVPLAPEAAAEALRRFQARPTAPPKARPGPTAVAVASELHVSLAEEDATAVELAKIYGRSGGKEMETTCGCVGPAAWCHPHVDLFFVILDSRS